MATTFHVYPSSAVIPSFQDILELSTLRLRERLRELGIRAEPIVEVNLHAINPHVARPVDVTTPARWERSEYAWFFVEPVPGGTDAYFCLVDQDWRRIWEYRASEPHPLQNRAPLVQACLENGHYWYFRRSMGQHATINLAYGLIAASVAELTGGYIDSDDNAWDYERFPARPSEFYTWYFRPTMAIDSEKKEWAERNLRHLAEELRARRLGLFRRS